MKKIIFFFASMACLLASANTWDLCDNISYEINLNSSSSANTYEFYLTITNTSDSVAFSAPDDLGYCHFTTLLNPSGILFQSDDQCVTPIPPGDSRIISYVFELTDTSITSISINLSLKNTLDQTLYCNQDFTFSLDGTSVPMLILNSGFESWEVSGNPAPFDWEKPYGWTSTSVMTQETSAGIYKNTNSYDGDYAVQLKSIAINNGIPSMLCNGSAKLLDDSSSYSIDIITGGQPVDTYEDSIITVSGHYIFDNNISTDSAYAVVILKKYNTTLDKIDTVAIGDILLGETSNYTSFEILLNYTGDNTEADSIVIAFYSTNPLNPNGPTTDNLGLLIDGISINQTTNNLSLIEAQANGIEVYPNPAKNYLFVRNAVGVDSEEIFLYSGMGELLATYLISNNGINIALEGYKPGVYYLKSKLSHKSQKFVICN